MLVVFSYNHHILLFFFFKKGGWPALKGADNPSHLKMEKKLGGCLISS